MKLNTKKTLEHGGVAVVAAVITAIVGFIVSFVKGIFDKKIDAQTEVVVEEPVTTETINNDAAEVVEAEIVTDETTTEQQ